jgi:hypothetical protein
LSIDNTNTPPQSVGRTAAIIVGGAIASLVFLIFAFGINPDLSDIDVIVFVAAKLIFSLGAVCLSSVFLMVIGHAGGSYWSGPRFILPLLGVMAIAGVSMAADPNWNEMLGRGQWLNCAVSVPIMTIIPFITIMGMVRMSAMPVDPAGTGAVIGLIAAGVSVIAYSLHCTVDPAPLVAFWFGSTSILAMLSGAKLGTRLLRAQPLKRSHYASSSRSVFRNLEVRCGHLFISHET